MKFARAWYVVVAAGCGFWLASCSAAGDPKTFGPTGGGAGGAGGAGGSGGATSGSAGGPNIDPCMGDECDPCPADEPTSISGTVLAPTPPQYGTPDPIYNAIVYVPSAAIEPFAPGVACDKCGAPVSGSPVAVALSDGKGQFTLKDVPAGTNVPLVIQIGRWRRQVIVPEVQACQTTVLPPELTRLPRNKAEGDIPRIAVASSTYDAEECILRKIGIDDAEFTAPSQDGRVHIYTGSGATIPGTPTMDSLWSSIDTLRRYDMVLFPCSSIPSLDPGTAYQNVFTYANEGGRVFATDLSYPWFRDGAAPFASTAQWTDWGPIAVDPLPALIDVSFPKGLALAEWLQAVGATTSPGRIDLSETYRVVNAVNPPSTRWLYSEFPVTTVQLFSFNTPVGLEPAEQCGRAIYSNFHIANGIAAGNTVFPGECSNAPLTPQEKVLEFLLFDLASCVGDDTEEPEPPPR